MIQEKGLTGDGRGHAAPEELEGVVSDHLGLLALAGVGSGRHHGGLQQDALEHDLHASRASEVARHPLVISILALCPYRSSKAAGDFR